jgi:hypothetical protein
MIRETWRAAEIAKDCEEAVIMKRMSRLDRDYGRPDPEGQP